MGVININNISGHDQLFYIHGWGQNDTTVGAGQMFTFDAPDGTSGAIIAVHEGREGEQVEVTKAGWGGLYFLHSVLCSFPTSSNSWSQVTMSSTLVS